MATVVMHNGVDVDRLVATIGPVQSDPDLARFTFRARSTWESGGRSLGEIREFEHAGATTTERPEPFELTGDEPPVLLGSNSGPNAVELSLQALAFCYGVGYVYNAAARGIDIEELRYEVEGDLDRHRFLGLGGPRAGFGHIRGRRPGSDRRMRPRQDSSMPSSGCSSASATRRSRRGCWRTRPAPTPVSSTTTSARWTTSSGESSSGSPIG